MVCPFRVEKIYERNIQTDVVYSEKEMFCDCYEEECPYYAQDDNGAFCWKATIDGNSSVSIGSVGR